LTAAEKMKPVFLFACLTVLSLGSCSWVPRAGPSASEVAEQSQAEGEILFDVVEVDQRVVSTLLAQPKESFAARFTSGAEPPPVKIAVGDTVVVSIWESAAGGLFSEAPPPVPTGSPSGVEPLAPESQPATPQARPGGPPRETLQPGAYGGEPGGHVEVIPELQVGSDGAISVPYAGRVPAAGRSPEEVQHMIEARLAQKALQPQALVIVRKTEANAVTVTGEVVTSSTRIPLSPGGSRLLEVVAAAGGVNAPPQEIFVKLSRGSVSATIPFRRLVSNPAEDIYAQPGDVLTLVRVPQTFSVFGATDRNAQIPFDTEQLSLSEALGKSQGLRDDLANPEGVFLFRYEHDSIVRSLDQPIASGTTGGVSPIVYRFNLRDGQSYLLAQQFPIEDKDVIFVADAPAVRSYKFATLLSTITGPVITGLLVCQNGRC
jgi:polysaccharide export outer membrane protein